MAKFFDKIGEVAKSAADKTNDMLELNRLNAKIGAAESSIAKLKEQIGNFYWEKAAAGAQPDAEIVAWCEAIQTAKEEIASLREAVAAIKGSAQPPAPPVPPTLSAPPALMKCPACGAENPTGTKFCSECGGKISG